MPIGRNWPGKAGAKHVAQRELLEQCADGGFLRYAENGKLLSGRPLSVAELTGVIDDYIHCYSHERNLLLPAGTKMQRRQKEKQNRLQNEVAVKQTVATLITRKYSSEQVCAHLFKHQGIRLHRSIICSKTVKPTAVSIPTCASSPNPTARYTAAVHG